MCLGFYSGKMVCTRLQVQDSRIIQQAFLLSQNTLIMASMKTQSYILLSGLEILSVNSSGEKCLARGVLGLCLHDQN